MLTHSIVRGACAGLLAGLLAGLFALVIAEPSIEAAIALEEQAEAAAANEAPVGGATARTALDRWPSSLHGGAQQLDALRAESPRHSETRILRAGLSLHRPHAHGPGHADGGDDALSRATQKLGLVIGMMLYGLALGALFGVVCAWAVGRVRGDAWTRALKLGCVAIGAWVLLPSLSYPPNPPAVGDPTTVGMRTGLFLTVWLAGSAIAVGGWIALRHLEALGWTRPAQHVSTGVGVVACVGLLLLALPDASGAAGFPADLLWSFRLSAIATQLVLFGGIAVGYGLLSVREGADALAQG